MIEVRTFPRDILSNHSNGSPRSYTVVRYFTLYYTAKTDNTTLSNIRAAQYCYSSPDPGMSSDVDRLRHVYPFL